eukprot:TRINITY_DN7807_c0_g1_i1.p1 TRINITY_DN7807_c0_g1~~TRINITY_DN7807_c0_g1_i1.p1  ORF type:complete len:1774 (+),score=381.69 TRINITY_DN7807_c0_g1_i1:626-5323(+)
MPVKLKSCNGKSVGRDDRKAAKEVAPELLAQAGAPASTSSAPNSAAGSEKDQSDDDDDGGATRSRRSSVSSLSSLMTENAELVFSFSGLVELVSLDSSGGAPITLDHASALKNLDQSLSSILAVPYLLRRIAPPSQALTSPAAAAAPAPINSPTALQGLSASSVLPPLPPAGHKTSFFSRAKPSAPVSRSRSSSAAALSTVSHPVDDDSVQRLILLVLARLERHASSVDIAISCLVRILLVFPPQMPNRDVKAVAQSPCVATLRSLLQANGTLYERPLASALSAIFVPQLFPDSTAAMPPDVKSALVTSLHLLCTATPRVFSKPTPLNTVPVPLVGPVLSLGLIAGVRGADHAYGQPDLRVVVELLEMCCDDVGAVADLRRNAAAMSALFDLLRSQLALHEVVVGPGADSGVGSVIPTPSVGSAASESSDARITVIQPISVDSQPSVSQQPETQELVNLLLEMLAKAARTDPAVIELARVAGIDEKINEQLRAMAPSSTPGKPSSLPARSQILLASLLHCAEALVFGAAQSTGTGNTGLLSTLASLLKVSDLHPTLLVALVHIACRMLLAASLESHPLSEDLSAFLVGLTEPQVLPRLAELIKLPSSESNQTNRRASSAVTVAVLELASHCLTFVAPMANSLWETMQLKKRCFSLLLPVPEADSSTAVVQVASATTLLLMPLSLYADGDVECFVALLNAIVHVPEQDASSNPGQPDAILLQHLLQLITKASLAHSLGSLPQSERSGLLLLILRLLLSNIKRACVSAAATQDRDKITDVCVAFLQGTKSWQTPELESSSDVADLVLQILKHEQSDSEIPTTWIETTPIASNVLLLLRAAVQLDPHGRVCWRVLRQLAVSLDGTNSSDRPVAMLSFEARAEGAETKRARLARMQAFYEAGGLDMLLGLVATRNSAAEATAALPFAPRSLVTTVLQNTEIVNELLDEEEKQRLEALGLHQQHTGGGVGENAIIAMHQARIERERALQKEQQSLLTQELEFERAEAVGDDDDGNDFGVNEPDQSDPQPSRFLFSNLTQATGSMPDTTPPMAHVIHGVLRVCVALLWSNQPDLQRQTRNTLRAIGNFQMLSAAIRRSGFTNCNNGARWLFIAEELFFFRFVSADGDFALVNLFDVAIQMSSEMLITVVSRILSTGTALTSNEELLLVHVLSLWRLVMLQLPALPFHSSDFVGRFCHLQIFTQLFPMQRVDPLVALLYYEMQFSANMPHSQKIADLAQLWATDIIRGYVTDILAEFLMLYTGSEYEILERINRLEATENVPLRPAVLADLLGAFADRSFYYGLDKYMRAMPVLFAPEEHVAGQFWLDVWSPTVGSGSDWLLVLSTKKLYLWKKATLSLATPCPVCPPEKFCPEPPVLLDTISLQSIVALNVGFGGQRVGIVYTKQSESKQLVCLCTSQRMSEQLLQVLKRLCAEEVLVAEDRFTPLLLQLKLVAPDQEVLHLFSALVKVNKWGRAQPRCFLLTDQFIYNFKEDASGLGVGNPTAKSLYLKLRSRYALSQIVRVEVPQTEPDQPQRLLLRFSDKNSFNLVFRCDVTWNRWLRVLRAVVPHDD